jgi:hypothetical protein
LFVALRIAVPVATAVKLAAELPVSWLAVLARMVCGLSEVTVVQE